jgi:lysophospholipase L1-like esterase
MSRWSAIAKRGNLVLASGSVIVCLCAAELLLRTFLPDPEAAWTMRQLPYRYDATLGWFPRERFEGIATGGYRTVRVRQNSLGFRDVEWGEKTRRRLAVVGDSFVWGYDAEQDERLTARLQEWLQEWQVMNLGVTGYGTDQEYLLSRMFLFRLQPDVVVLVHSPNDSRDNKTNQRYGPYYKPYFDKSGGSLRLAGVPVPQPLQYRYAAHPTLFWSRLTRTLAALALAPREPVVRVDDPTEDLLLAERRLVRLLGSKFAVGFVERNEPLEAACLRAGIPIIHFAGAAKYPEPGNHWTPDGHAEVARRLLDRLQQLAWVGPAAR